MFARTRHPRLAHAACALYGLSLWLYPAEFRRTFGRELLVTFRSRVEDELNGGGVRAWLVFAAHIAWDTIRASSTMMAAGDPSGSASLLGLTEGEVARGGIDCAAVDVQLLFAAAGLVLALCGWFAYFVILPAYVS